MTRQITFTLIAEGGTDRVLLPIIQWAIHRLDPQVDIVEPEFRKKESSVQETLQNLNSDSMLIFFHRDADNQPYAQRLEEFPVSTGINLVPVIPVRMTEAWLLVDGGAIAKAACVPSAMVSLPNTRTIESIVDPKAVLELLLLEAAGNPRGRRRKQFKRDIVEKRVDIATWISDFSRLESLDSFRRFQSRLREVYPYRVY